MAVRVVDQMRFEAAAEAPAQRHEVDAEQRRAGERSVELRLGSDRHAAGILEEQAVERIAGDEDARADAAPVGDRLTLLEADVRIEGHVAHAGDAVREPDAAEHLAKGRIEMRSRVDESRHHDFVAGIDHGAGVQRVVVRRDVDDDAVFDHKIGLAA